MGRKRTNKLEREEEGRGDRKMFEKMYIMSIM